MMALVAEWGGDLLVSVRGDVAVSPVQTEVQNRIIRRLLTNPGDYVWHTGYGGGLGNYVGSVVSPRTMESNIVYQLKYETFISFSPAPVVDIGESPSGSLSSVSVTIQYNVVNSFPGNDGIVKLSL